MIRNILMIILLKSIEFLMWVYVLVLNLRLILYEIIMIDNLYNLYIVLYFVGK